MSDSRKGRRSGKSVHQDSRPRPEKVVNGETEFKLGDSVIFNIRSADNPEKVVAITVADGVFKKQKFDISSLSGFVGVDAEIINERLDHALKFPTLRPLPLDTDARSHPYVKDGQHLALMDDCNIPKMISRRRAMVLKSFVFRHPIERTDLTKQPGMDKAIKKLKSQMQEKSSTIPGLYKESSDHVSRISRVVTTKSFPALSSVAKTKYTVEWTDELGTLWKEDTTLIGFDEIQMANEWHNSRYRSRGPRCNDWFCLREEESKGNGKTGKAPQIALDKDLFWSVAFFFNEIGTCGVEDWDEDLKAMRKRANQMTSKMWEFHVKPVEPKAVPVIEAGALWKKAKDCANDNFKRGKELREVLIYYKAAVKELQDKYGDEGGTYEGFMNSECAKLYTNLSATFYKIHEIGSNPRNDLEAALGSHDYKVAWDDPLEESFNMAKKAIACNKLWWKGYFYAARALHRNNQKAESLKYISTMLTSASINSTAQPLKVQEVQDFLVDLRYFTHLKILKESPLWHLVSHKNNVYVICPKGGGHFTHPVEAVRALRSKGKFGEREGCSLIIRPGTYNMDIDQNMQEDAEETSGIEENFVALTSSTSGAQFSASIVLCDGDALEMIGDFPALDYPTYDCGHQGAMNKIPPITFYTSGRIGQHMFLLKGEKSSLTLKRIYLKHYVRHPCFLIPEADPPSIIRMHGNRSDLIIGDSKLWTATQPAIHASGGLTLFSNSSLTDSGGGFILENNSKTTIQRSLISDVTTTFITSKHSNVFIEDTLIQNIGEWNLDYAMTFRGSGSRFEMINCQVLNPKIKEAALGVIQMREGTLKVVHCDFHSHKIESCQGVIDVGDLGSFLIEWNVFNLGQSVANTCALKLLNHVSGKFRFNRIQDGWKAIIIEDHMKASDEDLEIAGNMWESISGKKILVHEFDGPASIDGFRSQEIESVSEELASAKKIERLKAMLAEDNRRKKLLLPQPKEDKLAHEGMKEISRLRKMAPLRCEDVRVRFHLDRKCSCCRRFEHVYGPSFGTFKVCDRCKYRGDLYCSRECQLEHWPTHKHFCKKYKEIMKKSNN